jgi:hypothetical protein
VLAIADVFGQRDEFGVAENRDGFAGGVAGQLKACSSIDKVVSSALDHGVLKIPS